MHLRILIGIAVTIITLAFMVFQLLFGKNSIPEQRSISADIERYQAQIDSLNNVIMQRNELIKKLKTDSLYKEEILRTRYGMSRKGEKVFQFVR